MLRAIALLGAAGRAFQAPALGVAAPLSQRAAAATSAEMTDVALENPTCRDRDYADNAARYLVDLHEKKAVFDFCGGMMFQLVLTDALVEKLKGPDAPKVVIHDAATRRMAQVPGYDKSNFADDATFFHGREVRKVPNAAGGMNFVLQLSASGEDKDGWVAGERDGYDGWGHDSSRVWRDGKRLEDEGVAGFRERYGPNSFTLNHRLYLHLDNTNQLWLSAEDGCEGRLVDPGEKKKLFGLF